MKHIILLEDRPKRLKKFISEINSEKQNNLEVKQVLYYNDSLEEDSEQVAELKKELDTDVKIVNLWNFEQTLDQLYREEDTVFIFDAILEEKMENKVFSYRININYALKKRGEGNKIWFYTGYGPDIRETLEQTFQDHVIPASLEGNTLDILDIRLKESRSFRDACNLA